MLILRLGQSFAAVIFLDISLAFPYDNSGRLPMVSLDNPRRFHLVLSLLGLVDLVWC